MPRFGQGMWGWVACAAMMSAPWSAADARAGDDQRELLPASGGGEYELHMTSYHSVSGAAIFQSRARLLVHAVAPGAWRVGLLGVERYNSIQNFWEPILVDSVDPRTEGLPEGVELQFVVDGAPDVDALIPRDIPAIAFGLLLEATTMLAMCGEAAGLDRLQQVGDGAQFDGFTMEWVRPHGGPANRRVVEPGETRFESERDGVAEVVVAPGAVRWAMVRGWGDLRMSVGEESWSMRAQFDAETGELISAVVADSTLHMREVGAVDDATLPAEGEIVVPESAQVFTTPRSLTLRRVTPPSH